MTAVIALSKCAKHKRAYGIRFEKNGRNWFYTWAFPINEQAAHREKYDSTRISGNLIEGEEYPGCPYCHCKGFFYCSCGKLNCWDGESSSATCAWCGASGYLTNGLSSINITGNF